MIQPWMNKNEIDCIASLLTQDLTVLEWGSGGSTLFFAPMVKEWHSIEHNKQWFDKISQILPNNVNYYYVPANKAVSRRYSTHADYKDYIEIIDTIKGKFDVVLIDGRARVACARYVKNRLTKNGIIIIHDFFKSNRQSYHVLLNEFQEVKRIETPEPGLIILKP